MWDERGGVARAPWLPPGQAVQTPATLNPMRRIPDYVLVIVCCAALAAMLLFSSLLFNSGVTFPDNNQEDDDSAITLNVITDDARPLSINDRRQPQTRADTTKERRAQAQPSDDHHARPQEPQTQAPQSGQKPSGSSEPTRPGTSAPEGSQPPQNPPVSPIPNAPVPTSPSAPMTPAPPLVPLPDLGTPVRQIVAAVHQATDSAGDTVQQTGDAAADLLDRLTKRTAPPAGPG